MMYNFSKSPDIFLSEAGNIDSSINTELTLGSKLGSFLVKPTPQEQSFKLSDNSDQAETALLELSYEELINAKLNLLGNDLKVITDTSSNSNFIDDNSYIIKDYLVSKADIQTSDGVDVGYDLLSGLIRTPYELAAIRENLTSSSVGEVSSLQGQANIINATGLKVSLKPFSIISAGDIIQTASKSSVEVSFKDGTSFKLGPSAIASVDDFVFEDKSGVGNIVMSVFKGIFAFASGLVARDDPSNVKIKTPIAEIGLRGTKLAGAIDPNSESTVTLIEGRAVVKSSSGQYQLDKPWQTASDQTGSFTLTDGSYSDFLQSFKGVFPQAKDLTEFVERDYLSVIPKVFLDSSSNLKQLVKTEGTEDSTPDTDKNLVTSRIEGETSSEVDLNSNQDLNANNFADLLLQISAANAKELTYSDEIRAQFIKIINDSPWLNWLFDSNANGIGYENIALAETFTHTSTDSRIFGVSPENYKLIPDTPADSPVESLVNEYIIPTVDQYYNIVTKLAPVLSSITPGDKYYGQDSGFGLEFHLRNNDEAYGSNKHSDDYNLHLFIEDINLALLNGDIAMSDSKVKAYSVAGNLITDPNFKIVDTGENNNLIFNFYIVNNEVIEASNGEKVIDLSRDMTLFDNLDIAQFKNVVINLKFVTNAHEENNYKLKLDSDANINSDNFFTKWMAKVEGNGDYGLTINHYGRDGNTDSYKLLGSANEKQNFASDNFEFFGVELV